LKPYPVEKPAIKIYIITEAALLCELKQCIMGKNGQSSKSVSV
jgi:hypothetical protein